MAQLKALEFVINKHILPKLGISSTGHASYGMADVAHKINIKEVMKKYQTDNPNSAAASLQDDLRKGAKHPEIFLQSTASGNFSIIHPAGVKVQTPE